MLFDVKASSLTNGTHDVIPRCNQIEYNKALDHTLGLILVQQSMWECVLKHPSYADMLNKHSILQDCNINSEYCTLNYMHHSICTSFIYWMLHMIHGHLD